MINIIKSKLLESPEYIRELLEIYDYHHIHIKPTYISFGRSEDSSPKSIVIYLKDNENLIVKDFATNQSMDIFRYIITSRNKAFRDVIATAKKIVGVEGYCRSEEPYRAFQGFYANIKRKRQVEMPIYDESILDKYQAYGNLRFLKDGISLQVQHEFGIGYDIESQSITIPIRDEEGSLIAIKARINKDPEEYENKYFYLEKGMESQTLYNYTQSYEYLESADTIYVLEAEKGVMQYISKLGLRNCVALGSGSISKKQAQMLLSLNPNKIVFLHDVGYKEEFIMKNIQTVIAYAKMRQVEIGYWDNSNKGYEDKVSCTDLDVDKLKHILKSEIKYIERKTM